MTPRKTTSAFLLIASILFSSWCQGSAIDRELSNLISKGLQKAVLRDGNPTEKTLSQQDLEDLNMVLELEAAQDILAQDPSIFSFLDVNPIPGWNEHQRIDQKAWQYYKILDARKAATLSWLAGKGAAAQLKPTATTSNQAGIVLEQATRSAGYETVKVALSLTGPRVLQTREGARALGRAVDNCWIFPGSLGALLKASASGPDSPYDPLAALLDRYFTGSDALRPGQAAKSSTAGRNIHACMQALLGSRSQVSGDALRLAISIPLPELVERMLAQDPSHDDQTCTKWLVAAKMSNRDFPSQHFEKLKAMFIKQKDRRHKLLAKQQAYRESLPKVRAYFSAFSQTHGQELWTTDGTTEGTRLVVDATPGPQSSRITIWGTTRKGLLLSLATDRQKSRAFLAPNADPQRLLHLKALDSLAQDNTTAAHEVDDGFLVLSAGYSGGHAVWQTDGSENGTRQVTSPKLQLRYLLSHNGRVFATRVNDRQRETGTYELRPSASKLVPCLTVDPSNNNQRKLLPGYKAFGLTLGNRLFYHQNYGGPLMTGTVGTASEVPSPLLERLEANFSGSGGGATLGGHLYFSGEFEEKVDGRYFSKFGQELFRTDGTVANTSLVADICANPGDREGSKPANLTALQGCIVFTAHDGIHGRELWATDGTTTRMIKDLHPGTSSSISSHYTSPLLAFKGRAYFGHRSQTDGQWSLWTTDGTPQGTLPLIPIGNGKIRRLHDVGGAMLFCSGRELWRSDGTAKGTFKLKTFDSEIGSVHSTMPRQ